MKSIDYFLQLISATVLQGASDLSAPLHFLGTHVQHVDNLKSGHGSLHSRMYSVELNVGVCDHVFLQYCFTD